MTSDPVLGDTYGRMDQSTMITGSKMSRADTVCLSTHLETYIRANTLKGIGMGMESSRTLTEFWYKGLGSMEKERK